MISAAENSNKFLKTRFWKEKSIEDMVTVGPTPQATLILCEKPTIISLNVLHFNFQPKPCYQAHIIIQPIYLYVLHKLSQTAVQNDI